MATPEIRVASSPQAETTGSLAVLTGRRERLAIVSTRNTLCGIAAYTAALERQLAELFDVTVFDLSQPLLRNTHPRMRKVADRHIREICRDIATFDAVNIQLEHGTLGRSSKDIYRRFSWLAAAAPRLSVTFHTINRPPRLPFGNIVKAILARKWPDGIDDAFRHNRKLSIGIANLLRREERQKPVSVIVHNRRDRLEMEHVYRFGRVFDHPLSFLTPDDAEAVRRHATRRGFPLLDTVPADATLIGVFGFINDYKGFRTAIRALHDLPQAYHLLIFGGVHPNEVAVNQPIHPYVAGLLEDATVDARLFDQLRTAPVRDGLRINLDVRCSISDLLDVQSRELRSRVHFMGALDDDAFLCGMAICDMVVFPYLEVGQSASGPISQALELGCRIIASRSHTFLNFAAYHPHAIEFFDIGNHLELAERIAARPQYARREQPRYNTETNKAVYLAANSTAGPPGRRFSRRAPIPLRRHKNAAE